MAEVAVVLLSVYDPMLVLDFRTPAMINASTEMAIITDDVPLPNDDSRLPLQQQLRPDEIGIKTVAAFRDE